MMNMAVNHDLGLEELLWPEHDHKQERSVLPWGILGMAGIIRVQGSHWGDFVSPYFKRYFLIFDEQKFKQHIET